MGEETMKRITPFLWAIAVIIALGLGIYAGYGVMKAISDTEIMDLQVQLETANAALAEANVELAFWKSTIRDLAEGKQLERIDLEARSSKGD
jgi:hypothetical protein